MMAVAPVCSVICCKDQALPMRSTAQIERGMTSYCLSLEKTRSSFSPSIADGGRRSKLLLKAKQKQSVGTYCMLHIRSMLFQNTKEVPPLKVSSKDSNEKPSSGNLYKRAETCSQSFVSETVNCERQLKALNLYFGKSELESVPDTKESQMESPSQLDGKIREMANSIDWHITRTCLGSLENYFRKLNNGINKESSISPIGDEEASEGSRRRMLNSLTGEYSGKEKMMAESDSYKHLECMDNESGFVQFDDENIHGLPTYDEDFDFYLISLLAAINIAVFLFEIATPIRNSDIEHLSLPLIYGGKINKLILVGEWWRLFTPMFLHSGFPHVALSCWMLLTFGPQVCSVYGPFTFLLMYALGGISGSLTSFIHTPELTVCGTAPVFAIIGAWLVYQLQIKGVTAKEVSESMFWKAVIATALCCILSNFGRIDDWTHLGAALSGIIFGFLTHPALELDDSSQKNGAKEGIALVQRHADPCKSLLFFTLSILVLGLLVFFYGPQLEMMELDGFV